MKTNSTTAMFFGQPSKPLNDPAINPSKLNDAVPDMVELALAVESMWAARDGYKASNIFDSDLLRVVKQAQKVLKMIR